MRICILQDHLRSGGTERQSVLLARSFAAGGHKVTVLTFRPGGVLAGGLTAPGRAPVPEHEVLQRFDTRLDGFAPGLTQRLQTLVPDVVLCMGRMANGQGVLAKRVLPESVVVGTMRTGKQLQQGFRESLHVVDHVVANSEDSARVLRDVHGVSAERVSVIRNGLIFSPMDGCEKGRGVVAEALRNEHGVPANGVVLLCVGMLRPEKNQRAIIEAAARLNTRVPWQLWLAGEGPEREHCERLAQEMRLEERVRFLGFVENPTMLYRAADVAVLASKAESLSNFLIEAQAHGLPAVVMEVTGARECMREGVSGWVTPAEEMDGGVAFTAALRNCIEDTKARRAAGEAGRIFAREAFAPEKQVRAYLDLFERLRLKRDGAV